jgi:hypothetical protein
VRYVDEGGRQTVARATYVADAAGYSSTFHRACGQRMFADRFRNLALFCYYKGGKRLPRRCRAASSTSPSATGGSGTSRLGRPHQPRRGHHA